MDDLTGILTLKNDPLVIKHTEGRDDKKKGSR